MAAQSLIAVVGPTASGKTELGLELARRLGGELLSADSRQLYRHLDAGTAKPAGEWREGPEGRLFVASGVPCHLVDLLDPSERVDAARFAALARDAEQGVRRRGRVPVVVGGSGLYLRAFLEGLDPLPPRDPELRERLAARAEALGREWLHEQLSRVDPEAARRIPPGNLQRVLRALEVFELTGRPISSLWSGRGGSAREASPPLYLGIQWPRQELESRIRARAAAMLPAMLAELARLVPARYRGDEPGFRSLGYPEALACLRGEITREKALASTVRATLDYAKRQATWFGRQLAVRWIPAGSGDAAAWADAALARAAEGPP